MRSQKRPDSFSKSTTIDMTDKKQRDYWTQRWGVSIHQLRAAVRGCGSESVSEIKLYLKDNGAI